MLIRLPWTLRRLPVAVPISLALFLAAVGLAKVYRGFGSLCGPLPFSAANYLMMIVELRCATLFLIPGPPRRFVAMLVTLLMPGAAAFLAYAHIAGDDVRGCGCFGPVKLPFELHIVVCTIVFAAALLVLMFEEGRARMPARRGDPPGVT